ncbi:uncharacterized protein LOC101856281 [Aplysia californica]|uniref:Uncharacterized protein LOC101856281 n=1 Tax=Aplysia californica TaxID=6500 RepID=A0ABM0JZ64_APLCA|nr:uncharacterized protein LOC101856281 [Aplysia californica]
MVFCVRNMHAGAATGLSLVLAAGILLQLVLVGHALNLQTTDVNSKRSVSSLSLADDLLPHLERVLGMRKGLPRSRMNRLRDAYRRLLSIDGGDSEHGTVSEDVKDFPRQYRRTISDVEQEEDSSIQPSQTSYLNDSGDSEDVNNLYSLLKGGGGLESNSLPIVDFYPDVFDKLSAANSASEESLSSLNSGLFPANDFLQGYRSVESNGIREPGASDNVDDSADLLAGNQGEEGEERSKRQQGWYIQYGKRGGLSLAGRSDRAENSQSLPLLTSKLRGHLNSPPSSVDEQLTQFLERLVDSAHARLSSSFFAHDGANKRHRSNDAKMWWWNRNEKTATPVEKRQQGWYTQYGKRADDVRST